MNLQEDLWKVYRDYIKEKKLTGVPNIYYKYNSLTPEEMMTLDVLANTKAVSYTHLYYVHGFSDEMLQRIGEEKEKVLKEFVEYSKDSIIVGHNVQYDINILCSELERNNLGKPKFKTFYDTCLLYTSVIAGLGFAIADIINLRVHAFGFIELITRSPLMINAGLTKDLINFK